MYNLTPAIAQAVDFHPVTPTSTICHLVNELGEPSLQNGSREAGERIKDIYFAHLASVVQGMPV